MTCSDCLVRGEEHKGIASRRLFRESQSGARPSARRALEKYIGGSYIFRTHSATFTRLDQPLPLFDSPTVTLPGRLRLRTQALAAQTKLPADLPPLPFCCCVPGIASAASSSSSSSSSSSRLPPPASGLCGSRVDVDLAGGAGGAASPPVAAEEACHAGEE